MVTIRSIDSRVAEANISRAEEKVSISSENLSSGKRKDANVADFSVGSVLKSKVSVLNIAILNAGQAKSLLQTAKGGFNEISDLIQRQLELAVKSSDDSLSDNERSFLNQEFQAIESEINRISTTTEFNGKKLIDGSISGSAGIETSTGLSLENYGLISESDFSLLGEFQSGKLESDESKFSSNKITINDSISTATDNGEVTLTITAPNGNATLDDTSIKFTLDANSKQNTAANLAEAGNSTSLYFNFTDNGDGTVSVAAKESGNKLDNYTFQTTGASLSADDIQIGAETATDITAVSANFSTNQGAENEGFEGGFSSRASYNVGSTYASDTITLGATVSASDTINLQLTNGTTSIDIQFDTAATTLDGLNDELVAVFNDTTEADLVAGSKGAVTYNAGTGTDEEQINLLRSFTLEKISSSEIGIRSNSKGEALNQATLQILSAGATTFVNEDGDNIKTAAETISNLGSNRSVTLSEATTNSSLVGNLNDFKASFKAGVGNSRNAVSFSASINGTTYTTDDIALYGTGGLNGNGNTISARQELLFYDTSGPVNSLGELTDNVFVLKVSSQDISVAGTDIASTQQSLNDIASDFESQFTETKISQNRSLSFESINPGDGDHRIKSAVGTALEGLLAFNGTGNDRSDYSKGDIRLLSGDYDALGTQGNVSSFTVDRLLHRISTTIDGEEYTAYLSDSDLPTNGDVTSFGSDLNGANNLGSYDSTARVLTLSDNDSDNDGSTAKLHFFSKDATDGKILEIDLGNVSKLTSVIDIGTEEGAKSLENAFNSVFNVSSNNALSFQVGSGSTNTIGISIKSAQTKDLYKDESGVSQVLNISTIEDAQKSGDILSSANNNVISLIADVDATITQFNSSINNNESSVHNADSARSVLQDTDYAEESTVFAEARVQLDVGTAILAQLNARIPNIIQLLQN